MLVAAAATPCTAPCTSSPMRTARVQPDERPPDEDAVMLPVDSSSQVRDRVVEVAGYSSFTSTTGYGQINGFEFVFDTSKPAGYPRRVMDVGRAKEWIDWTPSTSLHDGLRETWEWFTANQTEYLKRQNYFR